MVTKFTPGPWEIGESDIESMAGACPVSVATILSENPADEALIAAAPDLYAALEEVVSDFASLLNSDYETRANPHPSDAQPALVRARAALAKARGE